MSPSESPRAAGGSREVAAHGVLQHEGVVGEGVLLLLLLADDLGPVLGPLELLEVVGHLVVVQVQGLRFLCRAEGGLAATAFRAPSPTGPALFLLFSWSSCIFTIFVFLVLLYQLSPFAICFLCSIVSPLRLIPLPSGVCIGIRAGRVEAEDSKQH